MCRLKAYFNMPSQQGLLKAAHLEDETVEPILKHFLQGQIKLFLANFYRGIWKQTWVFYIWELTFKPERYFFSKTPVAKVLHSEA